MSQLDATFLIKWNLALELMKISSLMLPLSDFNFTHWSRETMLHRHQHHLNREAKELQEGAVHGDMCVPSSILCRPVLSTG